jgi:uncharacterized DUF497 family protein
MPGFEWDPEKEIINVRKHGFDFTTASLIWNAQIIERSDNRRDYGEKRIIATGKVEETTLVVIYTQRGENRRIISARKAKAREKAFFEAELERDDRTPSY